MVKNVLFMLIILFLISNASALIVTPSTLNIDVYYNIEKNVLVNISNDKNYDLYEVEIVNSNEVQMNKVNITAGETKQVYIRIKTEESGDLSRVVKFIGYQKANCSELLQTTPYNISITEMGSSPSALKICKGESVRFINNYDSWIKLKIYPDTEWGGIIAPNSSYIRVFDNVGSYPFEVYPLIPGGNIEVSEEDVLVHSTEDDFDLSLNINSRLEKTNITILNIEKDKFTINYDGADGSYIVIKNIGDREAINVKLEGKWLSFDKNNFDLEEDESKAINFYITPYITSTSQTNKTYNINLNISGENIEVISKQLEVFIPHSSISEDNITSLEWWEAKKRFCDSYPTSPYCATKPVIIEKEVPKYDCPDILVNMTPEDVREYLRESLKAHDRAETVYNLVKLWLDNQNRTFDDFFVALNNSNMISRENKEEVEDIKNTIILLSIILVVMIMIVAGIVYGLKLYNRKRKLVKSL